VDHGWPDIPDLSCENQQPVAKFGSDVTLSELSADWYLTVATFVAFDWPRGSREALSTYTISLTPGGTFAREHSPHRRVFPMSSYNPLNQLRHLDKSSPNFHDQVGDVLHGEEYKKWVSNLQDNNLVGFVNHLDKVCYPASHHSPLKPL